MTTVLIIIGIVLVVALVLFLAKRIGARRQVKRLEGTSQERRQRAKEHNIRAAQLEQELERERVQADQHTSAAREAEEKLATKE
jgi:FtsZ-interacting cell division protein ZipA